MEAVYFGGEKLSCQEHGKFRNQNKGNKTQQINVASAIMPTRDTGHMDISKLSLPSTVHKTVDFTLEENYSKYWIG